MNIIIKACFCLLLFTSSLFAQSTVSGRIQYIIISENKEPVTGELIFNNDESLFTWMRYDLEEHLENTSSIESDESNTNFSIKTKGYDLMGAQVYRNFKSKTIKVRNPKQIIPSYTYIDNWTEIKWHISDEYKTIEGFKSQKATGQFRGRNYTAWFANSIPHQYGPWKLYGLPGVILEATDDKQIVQYRIKKICYPCSEKLCVKSPEEAINKTLLEHIQIQDNFSIFMTKYMGEQLAESLPESNVTMTTKDIPTEESIKKRRERSYEIIYEWENEHTKCVLDNSKIDEVNGNRVVIPQHSGRKG